MRAHRAVVEAGSVTVRQLCCAAASPADAETVGAALEAIDDRVGLLDGRPVAVASLWRAALGSLNCIPGNGVVVVHPSWWSSSRIAMVTSAAAAVADDVLARPRSWLLKRASHAPPDATAVVEIAERLVAITGTGVVAVPRTGEPRRVAGQVACTVADSHAAVVVIDAGSAADAGLIGLIADEVRGGGQTVVQVDDARLTRLARSLPGEPTAPPARPPGGRFRAPKPVLLAASALIAATVAGLPLAVSAQPPTHRHGVAAANLETVPTTALVEGRVALTVPANWPAQRVVTGPGSARVQITSPSDPEVALHVTQSPVVAETLSGTAERLRRALGAEPAGVFVDFNPSGSTAGRPAVTYREVRAAHHVRWTVFVDGPVRISVGCQSRPGDEAAVRDACEQAVRSARAIR